MYIDTCTHRYMYMYMCMYMYMYNCTYLCVTMNAKKGLWNVIKFGIQEGQLLLSLDT